MTWGVTMVMDWWGGLLMIFESLCKVLADSPIYSSSHPFSLHLYLYITPLLLVIGSLSFGGIRRPLMVWPPLKCTCTPCCYCCSEFACCCSWLHFWLGSGFSVLPYWWPIWGISISWGLCTGGFLPSATAVD